MNVLVEQQIPTKAVIGVPLRRVSEQRCRLTFIELLLKMPLHRVCCLPALLTLSEPSEEPAADPSPAEASSALLFSFVTMPR